jgi:hypothetical protein
VERLFGPIPSVGKVDPFDEIQNAASLLGAAKDLVNVVFLAVFDVIGLSENLGGVDGPTEITLSEWFQQRNIEDVMYLPFPWKRKFDSKWGNGFFDLEGAMIFVVHLLRWSARLNFPTVQHYQISNLISWLFPSVWVYVPAHSLLCLLEHLSGPFVHGVYPLRVNLAGGVEKICRSGVCRRRVESVISHPGIPRVTNGEER